MKNYVTPRIIVRNVQIKHYINGQSYEVGNGWDEEGDHAQLTKDRNDIWKSTDDTESIW